MIFKQFELVLSGAKTQTRRLVKNGERGEMMRLWNNDPIIFAVGTRFRIGQSYAIQPGRGVKAVGRIIVKSIRKEAVQAITEADALAEGVGSIEEYRALWNSIYAHQPENQWDKNPDVWVIEFEVMRGVYPN